MMITERRKMLNNQCINWIQNGLHKLQSYNDLLLYFAAHKKKLRILNVANLNYDRKLLWIWFHKCFQLENLNFLWKHFSQLVYAVCCIAGNNVFWAHCDGKTGFDAIKLSLTLIGSNIQENFPITRHSYYLPQHLSFKFQYWQCLMLSPLKIYTIPIYILWAE